MWGTLFRRLSPPPLRRERLATPDGDFVDIDWIANPADDGGGSDSGAGLILMLHGLEGSSRSHYATGLLREAHERGLGGAVLHFRSCSGELNRTPGLYHSGYTSDLDWLVRRLMAERAHCRIGLCGVSLGANVILKWLGDLGPEAPRAVRAAVAISTPFDLAACAAVLDRGINRRLYAEAFLRTMRPKVQAKAALLDGRVDLDAVAQARAFAAYDRAVTAPLYGFADEHDYWACCSSGRVLGAIRRPCLLINARNDPFVPPASLPGAVVRDSPWLEADFVPEGGHAGFLLGPWGRRSWAEHRAVNFLVRHLSE
jgi:predicted alpha/beta-fold hydrolase